MANYKQAPIIKNIGDKFQKDNGMGRAIRNHSLEEAIARGLGERDFAAYKVMMFLTGNAEGFAVAEKTICERCNISERAYKNARKKLAEMGWITHEQGKTIAVDYNKIMGCTQFTSEVDKEKEGCTQFTSKGCIQFTSKGCTQFTHNNIKNNIKNNINKEKERERIEIRESISELLDKGVDKEVSIPPDRSHSIR